MADQVRADRAQLCVGCFFSFVDPSPGALQGADPGRVARCLYVGATSRRQLVGMRLITLVKPRETQPAQVAWEKQCASKVDQDNFSVAHQDIGSVQIVMSNPQTPKMCQQGVQVGNDLRIALFQKSPFDLLHGQHQRIGMGEGDRHGAFWHSIEELALAPYQPQTQQHQGRAAKLAVVLPDHGHAALFHGQYIALEELPALLNEMGIHVRMIPGRHNIFH